MKPTDPPRCPICQVPKPFVAHWCCHAGEGCPETDQRVPTKETKRDWNMEAKYGT